MIINLAGASGRSRGSTWLGGVWCGCATGIAGGAIRAVVFGCVGLCVSYHVLSRRVASRLGHLTSLTRVIDILSKTLCVRGRWVRVVSLIYIFVYSFYIYTCIIRYYILFLTSFCSCET